MSSLRERSLLRGVHCCEWWQCQCWECVHCWEVCVAVSGDNVNAESVFTVERCRCSEWWQCQCWECSLLRGVRCSGWWQHQCWECSLLRGVRCSEWWQCQCWECSLLRGVRCSEWWQCQCWECSLLRGVVAVSGDKVSVESLWVLSLTLKGLLKAIQSSPRVDTEGEEAGVGQGELFTQEFVQCCVHLAKQGTGFSKLWLLKDLEVIKGKFLYSAVSGPQDRSKRFTLYFPNRPVHSDTISASLGSIQPYATINAQRLLVHISMTVYSQVLIYSAEWTGAM